MTAAAGGDAGGERRVEAPRLPPSPVLVTAEQVLTGAEDGSWTDGLFRGLRLSSADLEDGRFVDCRFEGCDLAAARFTRLSMRRVELVDCRLTGADFGGAHLHDVRFVACKLDDANLRMVQGERVAFDDTVLARADFQLATLVDAVFSGCRMEATTVQRATLTGATFPDCDLTDLLGIDGLRGAVVTRLQALQLAPRMAAHLGVVVGDD